MNVAKVTIGLATIEVGKADLLLLSNALNEVLHGIPIEEFETRLGASRDEVARTLEELKSLLDTM